MPLAAAGVDLLHYVPQDAFVTICHNVRIDLLRALPFVEWVGEYRSEDNKRIPPFCQRPTTQPPLDLGKCFACMHANATEIAAVRQLLDQVHRQSTLRSGIVLAGIIRPAQRDALARSDSVLWIKPTPHMKLNDEVASDIVAGDAGPGMLLPQSLGYDGRGVKVAVADSGLNNGDAATMHPDLFGRTPAFFFYGDLPDAADDR